MLLEDDVWREVKRLLADVAEERDGSDLSHRAEELLRRVEYETSATPEADEITSVADWITFHFSLVDTGQEENRRVLKGVD